MISGVSHLISDGANPIAPEHPIGTVIVGAGFAGIGMAATLKRAGIDDFVLLERAKEIGGTWRDNTYPGCACDIPSSLYSYSFAPRTDWTRTYPKQPEILAYLKDCLGHFDLPAHLQLNASVERAAFDQDQALWLIECSDKRVYRARALVLAMGGLTRPNIPDLPGQASFRGFAFHTARWDHAVELAGRHIGVIGTGASSIQVVPELARTASKVSVFQRTPAWVVARGDVAVMPRQASWLTSLKARLTRWSVYWRQEILAIAFTLTPRLMRSTERAARRAMYRVVPQDAMRQVLEPGYAMGCKRILISDDFYPALAQPNVFLLNQAVAAFSEDGVVTADGRHIALDGVVFATGFKTTDMFSDTVITGIGGESLQHAWKQRASAYLGITVPGFPNLFLMSGPNTGLGHNSIVFMLESQARYILQAIRILAREAGTSLEVRRERHLQFMAKLDKRMARTVWASGCNSWYLDEAGQNFTLWPGFTFEYWWQTRRLHLADFLFHPAGAHAGAKAAPA
jgi:cation diffusion facilitator CzcD-associated flavoprotein CzcO